MSIQKHSDRRSAGTWKLDRMTKVTAGDKIVAHIVAVDPPPYVGHVNYGPESKANAELIVRAVNAHDDLIAALKDAREIIGSIDSKDLDLWDMMGDPGVPGGTMTWTKRDEYLNFIDNALAKAGESSS